MYTPPTIFAFVYCILQTISTEETASFSKTVLDQYGIPGLMFLVLLGLYLKQNKNFTELQKKESDRIQSLLKDYAEVLSETRVIVEKNSMTMEKVSDSLDDFRDTMYRKYDN